MKAVKVRYLLKAKTKVLEDRNTPELVHAEISGAFTRKIDTKIYYDKFQFSLETSILPKYFGVIKEKRGVKNFVYDKDTVAKNYKNNKQFRDKLKKFETDIEIAIAHFYDEEPTAKEFKDYLMSVSNRNARRTKETFTVIKFLKNHIHHLESIIGSGRRDEVKDSTIDAFRNIIPWLNRYEEATNNVLTFENLNEKTYREIWDVANNIRQGKIKIASYDYNPKPAFAPNTIRVYQTYLLLLCKQAKKDGIEIKLDYSDKNLINEALKGHTEKTKAYISENDLQKVINYVPLTPNLKLAKEYIILASLTGMRLQSMLEANNREIELCNDKENGYDFYYLHTIQEKTGTECYTPLFGDALTIIQNNGNRFPNFNTIMLANLNKNIRKVLNYVEIKYASLISSHNCRSSFVSNLSLLSLSETVISYVTHPGKKDRKTSVYIYDRRNMTDKAKMFVDEIIRVNKVKHSKIYNF